uniref:Bactericidal permeability-increasing protein n=1 Tax=Varanus komodoensis TaxID=61221 RepID=A0A8D2J521_VARKO
MEFHEGMAICFACRGSSVLHAEDPKFSPWHQVRKERILPETLEMFNDVEFPNTSVSLIPGTGIKLSVNEASAIVIHCFFVSSRSSGRLMVFISGVSIVAVASASQDETGRPMLLLESCQGKVHEVNIQLDETASFKSLYLESYDIFSLQGTVYPVGKVTEPPIKPAPFTLPETMDCMFYIGVSEYFFQSASLAYFTCGAFNASTLSSYFKVTTDTLGSILPTVADRYAEPLPVMMNIVATAAPVIHLHNASFRLELAASVEMLAVLPNSTTQSMFTLNIVSTPAVESIHRSTAAVLDQAKGLSCLASCLPVADQIAKWEAHNRCNSTHLPFFPSNWYSAVISSHYGWQPL